MGELLSLLPLLLLLTLAETVRGVDILLPFAASFVELLEGGKDWEYS